MTDNLNKPSPKSKQTRNKTSFRSRITLHKRSSQPKKDIAEPGHPSVISSIETKVFGVSLLDAIDRSVIQDDILIPTVFRECIDYIEMCGLETEGLYRVGGPVKSIEAVKQQYDRGMIVISGGPRNLPARGQEVKSRATPDFLWFWFRQL